MKKKGISLIVLILTIIVVIILASVVIMTISKNNPVESAKEATFKEDIRSFQNDLEIYVGSEVLKDYSGVRDKITTSNESLKEEMNQYIKSFKEKYEGKIGIENDEIVYFKEKVTDKEEKWLQDLGIKSKKIIETSESDFTWGSNDPNNPNYGKISYYKGNDKVCVIPKRCTKIGPNCFYNYSANKSLEKIIINDGVTSIDSWFISESDNNLLEINVDKNNPNYYSENGILFNKDKTTIVRYPPGKKDIKYEIPNTVKIIGEHAFQYCNNLEEIVIPNSVTKICYNAIRNCAKLKEINIPNSVTQIEFGFNTYNQFSYCDSLTTINTSKDNPNFSSEDGILYNKNKTALYKFPPGKSMKKYTLPISVNYVESHAFSSCINLEEVELNENINSLNGYTFYSSKIKKITLPNSLTSILSFAFYNCDEIEEIEIPNNVKRIAWYSFANCDKLKKVILSDNIESIGLNCFSYCYSLESIYLPNSLKSIEREAFNGCTSLNSIFIPISVTKMNSYVFSGNMTINCEAESKPDGWDTNWIGSYNNVNWGCTR